MTFVIFWTMQALISVPGHLQEPAPKLSIDFVRLRRDITPPEKKREPPRREKPEAAPPPPDISMSKATLDPGGESVAGIAPDLNPSQALTGSIGTAAGTDREIVPLVRIDPEYPIQARQRGIEGWVEVRFTVSPIGSVQDAVVVRANPPEIFNTAALQAVRKWKYNPKIQNGMAVAQTTQALIDFSMEK
jgi:protein TonB